MHAQQAEYSMSVSDGHGHLPDTQLPEVEARMAVYRLVGRCLEEEIDAGLLRLLRDSLRQPLQEAGWVLDPGFLEDPEEVVLESMAEEFTGLFVAPGGVSPYASVFETGCMYRDPSERVVTAYRQAGWDYRQRMSGEFPDHIGTMISFLGQLTATELEARQCGDLATATRARRSHDQFLVAELGPWGPGWCRRAAQAALLPFYSQLAQFTEQMLWQELAAATDRRRLKELVALNQREPKKLDYDADFRKASGI